MRGLGGTDSLNTTGRVLLTGVFSLMRPYLPLVIVALATVSLGIDSLNTTSRELLAGVSSLTRPSLYYHCALEGSMNYLDFSRMIPLRIPIFLPCGKPMFFDRYVKIPQLSSLMVSYCTNPNLTR
jgi:hypothetical protein